MPRIDKISISSFASPKQAHRCFDKIHNMRFFGASFQKVTFGKRGYSLFAFDF